MKVLSAREMQLLDRRTIEEYGLCGLVLMENAGIGVVREMVRRYGPLDHKTVTVIAGKGNNGGDGFVIARHLHQKGIRVGVLLLGRAGQAKGDARTNLQIYEKIGGDLQELPQSLSAKRDIETVQARLHRSHLIVDAIFGTGLAGSLLDQPGQTAAQVISLMNESAKPVVAVDIPSGISSDTGEVLGAAVKADLTVTFELPKRGHYLHPGAAFRGALRVVEIGIPSSLVRELSAPVQLLLRREIRENLPDRPPEAHKGRFGHVLVIAGSVGKTGAAALAAHSALRAGAGLVTLATPSSLNPVLEQKLTEAMTVPLPETPSQTLSLRAEKDLMDLARGKTAIILGPGLSTHPETQELVRKLLGTLEIPVVLDADGINALAGHTALLGQCRATLILSPHPGEMGRLLGTTSQKVQEDRLGISQDFARQHRLWLVLKGAYTVLADPDGRLFINPTGNEGMATGGTGDVLSGILGGLIAQGLSPSQAIKVGVYLHGLAGDLAASQKGNTGMIATDLMECLPPAIQEIRFVSGEPDPYNPLSP